MVKSIGRTINIMHDIPIERTSHTFNQWLVFLFIYLYLARISGGLFCHQLITIIDLVWYVEQKNIIHTMSRCIPFPNGLNDVVRCRPLFVLFFLFKNGLFQLNVDAANLMKMTCSNNRRDIN